MNPNPILAAAATGGSGSTVIMIVYVVIIVGAMYFLLIRPQRKRTKEEKQLRESVQIGDEIVTIGGIYGRVLSLKEDTLVIESKSDHTKLTIGRWAIQTNLTPHETPKTAANSKAIKEKKVKEKTEDNK